MRKKNKKLVKWTFTSLSTSVQLRNWVPVLTMSFSWGIKNINTGCIKNFYNVIVYSF